MLAKVRQAAAVVKEIQISLPDRILIADDEEDIRDLVKLVLEGEGYEVVTASDGDAAIRMAGEYHPDLLLQDVVLPGKNGFEVCRILKSQASTQFVPVVISSVLNREVDRRQAEAAGADGYMTKPSTADGIVKEVRRYLENTKKVRFSKQVGLEHSSLVGRKILLGFDPATPYERFVRDLVVEATAHAERIVVVTTAGGVVHGSIQDEPGVELVLDIHEFLTPYLRPRGPGGVNIVFDSLTDLTLSATFQTAYNSTRNLLMHADGRTTMLFLVNPLAHPQGDAQLLRALFSNQLSYGSEGLKRDKLTEGAPARRLAPDRIVGSAGKDGDSSLATKEVLQRQMNEIGER